MPRKIEVGDLSGKTLNYLSHSLDKPTLNSWEDLMRSQTFRSIYPTDAPEKIRLKSQGLVHPAESLLQDLAKRKTPLEDLICGLREIGNKEAISIIEHREKWLEGKLFFIGRRRLIRHGLKHICGNVLFSDFDRISS